MAKQEFYWQRVQDNVYDCVKAELWTNGPVYQLVKKTSLLSRLFSSPALDVYASLGSTTSNNVAVWKRKS